MNLKNSPLFRALIGISLAVLFWFLFFAIQAVLFPDSSETAVAWMFWIDWILAILIVRSLLPKAPRPEPPPPAIDREPVTLSKDDIFFEEPETEEPPPYTPEFISEPAPVYPPPVRPMFQCRFCGCDMPVGAQFCNTCGASTTADFYRQAGAKRHTCRRCRSQNVKYVPVSEYQGSGCLTWLLYIILAITVLGFLIIIPLALSSKSHTSTYVVCQDCGWKRRLWR